MADETIEIEYQLDKSDYTLFYKSLDFYKKQSKIPYLLIFKNAVIDGLQFFAGTYFILFLLQIIFSKGEILKVITQFISYEKIVISFLIGIFTFVLCYFSNLFFYKKRYDNFFNNTISDLEFVKTVCSKPIKLSLDDRKILLESAVDLRKFTWNDFKRIELEKNCFYIQFLNSTIFIPARFFKSNDHMNEVFQKCQQWFSEANKEGQNVA